jgi:hypothetical protein
MSSLGGALEKHGGTGTILGVLLSRITTNHHRCGAFKAFDLSITTIDTTENTENMLDVLGG